MMSWSLIASLTVFALVGSVTPGPNNVMLASSGLNYGVRRTVPHMAGITVGFMVMLLVVGLGLGTVLQQSPVLHRGLQWVCVAYLLYLAWQIATAQPATVQSQGSKPFSFLQAALFQWVNPKAWVFSTGVVAVYVPAAEFFLNLFVAMLVCGLTNIPSVFIWTWFGRSLRCFLQKPAAVRRFNVCMGLLLVLSLYPMMGSF